MAITVDQLNKLLDQGVIVGLSFASAAFTKAETSKKSAQRALGYAENSYQESLLSLAALTESDGVSLEKIKTVTTDIGRLREKIDEAKRVMNHQ